MGPNEGSKTISVYKGFTIVLMKNGYVYGKCGVINSGRKDTKEELKNRIDEYISLNTKDKAVENIS